MAYRSKVALVYLLGFALDLLNMFAASIAYPDIARQLHASVTQLAWITNAYMLGLTLIIPMSVWLAARVGERRLILGSLLVFAIASGLVAQAGSIESLIGWRLLQGLGAGCCCRSVRPWPIESFLRRSARTSPVWCCWWR